LLAISKLTGFHSRTSRVVTHVMSSESDVKALQQLVDRLYISLISA
jgi:hypothetical protein